MRGRRYWFWKVPAFAVFVLAVVALLSWIVMSLWNVLIPQLFHGPFLSFWQAAGLLVLCRILFGGFKGHHGRRGGYGRWHRLNRQKWESMTPEERARMRERFGRYCWGAPDSGDRTEPRGAAEPRGE